MKAIGIFVNARLDTVELLFFPNSNQYPHSKTFSNDNSAKKEESSPYNTSIFIWSLHTYQQQDRTYKDWSTK